MERQELGSRVVLEDCVSHGRPATVTFGAVGGSIRYSVLTAIIRYRERLLQFHTEQRQSVNDKACPCARLRDRQTREPPRAIKQQLRKGGPASPGAQQSSGAPSLRCGSKVRSRSNHAARVEFLNALPSPRLCRWWRFLFAGFARFDALLGRVVVGAFQEHPFRRAHTLPNNLGRGIKRSGRGCNCRCLISWLHPRPDRNGGLELLLSDSGLIGVVW